MTNEEKLKIFEYYLNKIKTKAIKEFTEFALIRVPEYFWTLLASTTKKNHGQGETVIDHTLACLALAEQVCDGQFKTHWEQERKDELYSSLMLHDTYRCGHPDKELRITQEVIDKKKLDQSLLGELMTSRDHPEIGFLELSKLMREFIIESGKTGKDLILDISSNNILCGVFYHYGPFSNKGVFDMKLPYDSVILQVHNIDFHQCHNSMYLTRKNCKHTESVGVKDMLNKASEEVKQWPTWMKTPEIRNINKKGE